MSQTQLRQDIVSPPLHSSPEAILARAQASREIIQDFVPLAESLEWHLGQQYLSQRGHKAFLSDANPVPFLVNNDGTLSCNAAAVFFASLQHAEQQGELERDLFVLELGIGLGLFARYFLNALRDLCDRHHKDYYSRLTYILADHSEQMLRDLCRNGILGDHPGRYCVRQVDALHPAERLLADVMFVGHAGKPFRAVFLNYVLDCLPAASLQISGEKVRQLCVRICVARNICLKDFTDLTARQLADRACSADTAARQDLLEVYGLFASEYAYRPVDMKSLPYGDFALEHARRSSRRLLHSYGAIQSLERLMELVHNQGFILVNDYGQTQTTREDEFEHQRFSLVSLARKPALNSGEPRQPVLSRFPHEFCGFRRVTPHCHRYRLGCKFSCQKH